MRRNARFRSHQIRAEERKELGTIKEHNGPGIGGEVGVRPPKHLLLTRGAVVWGDTRNCAYGQVRHPPWTRRKIQPRRPSRNASRDVRSGSPTRLNSRSRPCYKSQIRRNLHNTSVCGHRASRPAQPGNPNLHNLKIHVHSRSLGLRDNSAIRIYRAAV